MNAPNPALIESASLPYLLSLPTGGEADDARPVLCFLHGYDEGAPTPIRQALTRHGPLRPGNPPRVASEFIVVAPQLPTRGDLWFRYADAVAEIVREVHRAHGGDPARTYLTGFSFGGNGVFDLALAQRGTWAALWPVDPTRVPTADPGLPLWLSSGQVSRYGERGFVQRLGLTPPEGSRDGDRVIVDRGQDHVGTATLAYGDEQIYDWLLARSLPEPSA